MLIEESWGGVTSSKTLWLAVIVTCAFATIHDDTTIKEKLEKKIEAIIFFL